MSSFLFLSEKDWHAGLFYSLASKFPTHRWHLINKKEKLLVDTLKEINPDKIFIPHWSYMIPDYIFDNYECIVFHMTDLPFGRGGSPLQNLIVRGYLSTKISALKVQKGIDSGPIYLKKNLSLEGTAKDIFLRASKVIGHMISQIIENNIKPNNQEGEILEFKRRKPHQSDISKLSCLNKVYDYIRMLDCEGYPPAYIETEALKLEFYEVERVTLNELKANVRIVKK
ncbi:methionyl-tRNA formyltransferase [Maribacter sp. PR1]|uniref:Methionyl-tRNA formyltransferase n=1 Tax=Maribacter cobaltidurans TaxID=1178778 RepID=A0ABU7IQF9_9FLAO|nr:MULTISPECIES: methionyl-tRNA formyltransferase [Maribacter]MDC6387802.1 methionyl-tRNA formyltransferase [Maribacter sp. PR1]MEE1975190.1 methionyl-tRNA formyltransferase [Maribacter cobaltidurans]